MAVLLRFLILELPQVLIDIALLDLVVEAIPAHRCVLNAAERDIPSREVLTANRAAETLSVPKASARLDRRVLDRALAAGTDRAVLCGARPALENAVVEDTRVRFERLLAN